MSDASDRPNASTAAAAARLLRSRAIEHDLWIDVTGVSMSPTLEPPARVLIRPAPRPRPGQVWAYVEDGGAIVVHRFLRRQRSGWLLFRGDGMPADDGVVADAHLVGRVVRMEDRDGARPVRVRLGPVVRSFARAMLDRARSVVGRR